MKKTKLSKVLAVITAAAVAVTMTPFIAFADIENGSGETINDEVSMEITAEATAKNECSFKLAANKKTKITLSEEGAIKVDKGTQEERTIQITDSLAVRGLTFADLLKGQEYREDLLQVQIIAYDTENAGTSLTSDPMMFSDVQDQYVLARGVDVEGTVTNNSATYIDSKDNEYTTCFAIYKIGEGQQYAAADQIKLFYDFGGDPYTFKVSGTGVKEAKTVTIDELKAMAQDKGLVKTRKYYAYNSEGSKTLFVEEGIYFEDLFKLKGLGINKGVNDQFEYRLLDAFGDMKISDYTSEDIYGNKPMLAWTETIKFGTNLKSEEEEIIDEPQNLEQLKLVFGQSTSTEQNQPNWKKYITEFVFTGGVVVPEVGTALTTSNGTYVVTVEEQAVSLAKSVNKKSVTIPATVAINGITYKVTGISAKAFANSKKVKSVTVKTKGLTKASVAGSLKSSKVKKIKVKVGSKKENKAFVKTYKKAFKKSNSGKTVKVYR